MTLLDDLWDSVGGGHLPKPTGDGTAHLDSKLVDAASEGWNGERPDDFLFSDFGTFRRHLNEDDPSDAPRRLADAHVLLLMSTITERLGTHTVVFQDDGGQGGLYVRIDVTPLTVDVAFVSNYAQLEYKEAWYQAVLSLYEWYAYPTGTFNVNIYRKSWPRPQTTLNISTQLSEIIVYVFDVMRSGSFRLLVSNLEQFPRLDEKMAQLVVWPIEADFTFAERAVRLTRSVGMIPEPTQNSIQQELTLGSTNVPNAYELAAISDDEVGMTSLSELARLLRMRRHYLSDMRDVLMDILYNQNFDEDLDEDDGEDEDWEEDSLDESFADEPYTFDEFDPDSFIQELIDAKFLSVAGIGGFSDGGDAGTVQSEAQGMRFGWSDYTGEIGAYTVDVGVVLERAGTLDPASIDRTMEAALTMSDDEAILACYAWEGVVAWLSRRRTDAEVDKDIAEQFAAVLAQYRPQLVWKRPVPEPEVLVSRFETVRPLLARLMNETNLTVVRRWSVEEIRVQGDSLARDADLEDPEFTTVDVQLDVFGARSPVVRLDILCTDRWAQEGPHLLDAMFDEHEPHLFVSDDGWVVRIVDTNAALMPFALRRLAIEVQNALGGQVREHGVFDPTSNRGT